MPAISVSAPGKLILCGEHAVVYRQPAIAIPLQQVKTTTHIFAHPTAPQGEIHLVADAIGFEGSLFDLDESNPIRAALNLVKAYFSIVHFPACEIRIHSTIPIASGLGSSASVSVSLISALCEFLGHPLPVHEINQLAFEVEKLHHGTPSGVDNTVIAYNQPVYFIRGELLEFLQVASPLYFVVANTGIPGSTAEAVAKVRQNWQNDPQKLEGTFSQIGEISKKMRTQIQAATTSAIGTLMNDNHALLQTLQVSCPELDLLVSTARAAGALGAKLSGGGLGGNMIALVEPETAEGVLQALLQAGAVSAFETTLAPTERG
ncbi:MAG: mevalonate kinase [Anaerolineaceae bacterium]|nr:mevalonate kinase [Anaerolineaceae bacterium]